MMKALSWSKILILFVLFAAACGSKKETGYGHLVEQKEAKIREAGYLPVEYLFYRENDTLSKLFYRIDPKHFLNKYDSLSVKNTRYRLDFQVRNNHLGSKTLFETTIESKLIDSTIVLDSLVFVIPKNKTVYYELVITDLNKRVSKTYSDFWERENDFIPEDFLLFSRKTNQVLTRPYIFNQKVTVRSRKKEERFKVILYQSSQGQAQKMYVLDNNPLYAKNEVESEQFVGLKELEDLLNSLSVETYVKVESTSEEKQVSFNVTKMIIDEAPSIQPLVYLLPKEEEVSFNSWVKFWSNASGNDVLKAEKLIAEFNRRVEYANANFSSHKLGWKTDRGMMYLLHGPPDRVYDDVRTETWSYGFTSSVEISFVFVRNPMGLNRADYVLERSMAYRDIEKSAVQRWENGWIKYGLDGNQ